MSEPIWIEQELVLAIHDRLLVEHGLAGRMVMFAPSTCWRNVSIKLESIDMCAPNVARLDIT